MSPLLGLSIQKWQVRSQVWSALQRLYFSEQRFSCFYKQRQHQWCRLEPSGGSPLSPWIFTAHLLYAGPHSGHWRQRREPGEVSTLVDLGTVVVECGYWQQADKQGESQDSAPPSGPCSQGAFSGGLPDRPWKSVPPSPHTSISKYLYIHWSTVPLEH